MMMHWSTLLSLFHEGIERAFTSNSRIHLTRWAVTALAEKHRSSDHRFGLPGPRRPQLAGDANVRHEGASGEK